MGICPICLEPSQRPWKSPCGHTYCQLCIVEWVHRRHHSCPICRANLTPTMITSDDTRFLSFAWVNPFEFAPKSFALVHFLLWCINTTFFYYLRPRSSIVVLTMDGFLLTASLSTMGQILCFLVLNLIHEWSTLRRKLHARSTAVAPIPTL
ncbi:hypothetical protein THRCLA_20339 [Thraustotheca clavata]|uniref:RING-type domain-containing protein n=1 Tax=Thraustotheca clavata TaxID=74557 RepID=A0A1W0A8I4_9STRA|nr:hypothetical protein THRCLA_20339 [Thraustotheca clavata]